MTAATQLQVHSPDEIVPLPAKVPGSADNFLALFQHPEAIRRITPLLAPGDAYERIVAVAMRAARKTPTILRCTPTSILDAAATIIGWNLEIGETAYLVPYGEVCTPIMDYKGMGQMLIASKVVRAIEPWCVYQSEVDAGDFKIWAGSESRILHVPHWKGSNRGPMVGAYTVFQLAHNRSTFKFMSVEEIEEIRQTYSKQHKGGPLKPWYAIKTTIRQARKVLGSTPALTRAFAAFEQEEELSRPIELPLLESGEDRPVSTEAFSAPRPAEPSPLEEARADATRMPDEPSMSIEAANVYLMPLGQHKDEMIGTLDTATLRTALIWCWERADTGDRRDVAAREFQLALATVLDAREKQLAAKQHETTGDPAAVAGAVQDSPGGTNPNSFAPPASDAAPLDPKQMSRAALQAEAFDLLEHPAMSHAFVSGIHQEIAADITKEALEKTVRQLRAMIASLPEPGKSRGELPGVA